MKEYEFRVILEETTAEYDRLEARLLAAELNDAYVGATDDLLHVDFVRRARSPRQAILSAIRDIRSAGFTVNRLDTDELVTAAEIARRTGRSRESIRLLATGERGPGGFPPPVGRSLRSRRWRWSEVAPWLERIGLLERGFSEEARAISAVNAAIDLLRNAPSSKNRHAIIEALQSG